MAKHPGTSGLIPVKGTGCGIRPDPEAMENSEGFDFSEAVHFLHTEKEKESDSEQSLNKAQNKNPDKTNKPGNEN